MPLSCLNEILGWSIEVTCHCHHRSWTKDANIKCKSVTCTKTIIHVPWPVTLSEDICFTGQKESWSLSRVDRRAVTAHCLHFTMEDPAIASDLSLTEPLHLWTFLLFYYSRYIRLLKQARWHTASQLYTIISCNISCVLENKTIK